MSLYYEDEFVELHHGDCRGIRGWTTADVLVSDPPYGIGWKKGLNKASKSKAHAGIQNDQDTAARDEMLELWGDRPAMVFGSWRAPEPSGVVQRLVWRKPADAGVVGSVTGFRNDTELVFLTGAWPRRNAAWSSVLETNVGMHAYLSGHPHSKPVGLMEALIAKTPPRNHCRPVRRVRGDAHRGPQPRPEGDRRRGRREVLRVDRSASRAAGVRVRGAVT